MKFFRWLKSWLILDSNTPHTLQASLIVRCQCLCHFPSNCPHETIWQGWDNMARIGNDRSIIWGFRTLTLSWFRELGNRLWHFSNTSTGSMMNTRIKMSSFERKDNSFFLHRESGIHNWISYHSPKNRDHSQSNSGKSVKHGMALSNYYIALKECNSWSLKIKFSQSTAL